MDDVIIYAIDTSTLWTLHGQLTQTEARPLFESAIASGAPGLLAGAALAVASECKASAAQPEGQQALRACTAYLGQTETYRQVLAKKGSVAGHWLVVLYRFASGDATLRPMYMGAYAEQPGRLQPEYLMHSLLEVIKRDLRPDGGMLIPRIQTQGDVQFAPALAQRVRPH
jgi:hypothetical protein